MKKKKILHIVEAFGGGIFSILCDLCNETSKSYDIIIAYSLRAETPKNFKEYFSTNIKFIEVENLSRSINAKKDIKALKRIKEIIKEEKPDIIHLHSSKAGILGRLAISGKKVRMFYNPHGFSFLKKDDSIIKRAVYWTIEKITAIVNKKCTIVACSYGEYGQAKKLNKNAIWINNGVNIKKLEKEISDIKYKEIDYNDVKICTIGRIGYQKNPDMFNGIAQKFLNFKFMWIGEGDLKNRLTSPNIEITGWKENKEVLELLNNNDIFILTSLWEGLPVALLEAMYMRKICVVSNCIGNKDVIINGENGYISNNINEFENNIKRIITNKEKNDIIISKAYQDVIEKYNVEVMIKNYEKVYSK